MKQITTKLLLRISAGLILFFALGHSVGHFTRHQVTDPKIKEIQQIMIDNKFDMFGQMRSFDEIYEGMSLNLIFILLALAFVLWTLSKYSQTQPKLVRQLLLPIALLILGFTITGFRYFFSVPAITCLITTILLIKTILKLNEIIERN